MIDLTPATEPKTDQLNSDSLIAGPLTITVSKVSIAPGTEQPVVISYDGDEGRPYKPCKSMVRVLVSLWGADASKYPGRSLTLYRDPKVKWGGLEVGGIRISHMTHIERETVMALTETRASRKPFTVKPLKVETKAAPKADPDFDATTWAARWRDRFASVESAAQWEAVSKMWEDDRPTRLSLKGTEIGREIGALATDVGKRMEGV